MHTEHTITCLDDLLAIGRREGGTIVLPRGDYILVATIDVSPLRHDDGPEVQGPARGALEDSTLVPRRRQGERATREVGG